MELEMNIGLRFFWIWSVCLESYLSFPVIHSYIYLLNCLFIYFLLSIIIFLFSVIYLFVYLFVYLLIYFVYFLLFIS